MVRHMVFRVWKIQDLPALSVRGLKIKIIGKHLRVIKIKSKVNILMRNVEELAIQIVVIMRSSKEQDKTDHEKQKKLY